MTPRIAVFRHSPGEPLGYCETVFHEQGIVSEYINLYNTNEIPVQVPATRLIFLGGPMSVNDEEEFPWLSDEKEIIRRSGKDGKKVLGICLGAQLIAAAFGAKVYRFVQETGWQMLQREEGAPGIFSRFPDRFPAFQLHGDTFEIPCGGRLLARGARVRNQAFFCRNALGLQFHLELTPAIAADWAKDLSAYQRSRIARDTPRFITESNRLCRLVAEDFLR